jgi:hypothetical protein
LLLGLGLEVGQDPLPVGEALSAGQARRHFSVRDLPVMDRVLGGQEGLLDEAPRALVALFAADAWGQCYVWIITVLVANFCKNRAVFMKHKIMCIQICLV